MLRKRLSSIILSISMLIAGISFILPNKNLLSAEAVSYIDIDAGPIYGAFIKPWNQDNGFFFHLAKNAAPFGNYNQSYRPTSEANIKIKRNGVTYDACKFDPNYLTRDTIYKLSETEYSLNTSSGWYIKEEYLPLQPFDEIFVSGIFINSVYRVNITESSFKLDENKLVTRSNVIDENLSITGNLNLEGKDKIYFDTNKNQCCYLPSGWPEYYSIEVGNNVTICRDKTSFNKKAIFYAKSNTEWQLSLNPDFDSANNYSPINGDILYLGGHYYSDDYDNDKSYRCTFNNAVFLMKEVNGVFSISQVTDPGTLLLDKMQKLVDIDIYTGEAQKTILDAFHSFKELAKDKTITFGELWDVYVSTINYLETLPTDPEAEQNKLVQLRLNGVYEVLNYVSLDSYLPSQVSQIELKQVEIINNINAANNRNEIDVLVKEYKDFVLSLKSRKDIYTTTVLANNPKGAACTEINNQYLANYDVVTIPDLGLSENITFNAESSLRGKNIDTDESYDNTFNNTFPLSSNNTTNSVAFRFKYVVSDNNMRMAISIKLRGIRYAGYKFVLSDSNYGIFVKRTPKVEQEKFLGGKENLFNNKGTYNCEIGAIDIIDTDQVYLYAICNNVLVESVVCDKLPFNHNRIDIRVESITSSSGNISLQSIGDTTFKGVHLGIFDVADYNDDVINLYAEENNIPYDSNKTIETFALRNDCIKLFRNNQTYNVAQSDQAVIYKYTDNLYAFNIGCITDNFVEGDKLILEGNFASFSSFSSEKIPFYVSRTELLYSNNGWSRIAPSLEEEKEEALYKLNNFGKEEDYFEDDYILLQNILQEGISSVNNATSVDDVHFVLEDTISQASNILTILQKKQNSAIEAIVTKVEEIEDDYFIEEYNEILDLAESYSTKIKSSNSFDDIDAYKDEFMLKIQSIYTKSQRLVAELIEAKENAISDIRDLYGKYNIDSLPESQISEVNNMIKTAINDIENASDIETVNGIRDNTINVLNSIFNKPSGPNLGLVIGLSIGGGVLLIGVVLTVVFIIKKKAKETK